MTKLGKIYVYIFYTLKSYEKDNFVNYYLCRRKYIRLLFILFELPVFIIASFFDYINHVNKSFGHCSIQVRKEVDNKKKEYYKRVLYKDVCR